MFAAVMDPVPLSPSARRIVFTASPARRASSAIEISSNPRAARIWAPINKPHHQHKGIALFRQCCT
jgi:hypothetical protein